MFPFPHDFQILNVKMIYSSDSDSDDDCYGNIAERLQELRNKSQKKIESEPKPPEVPKLNEVTEDVDCIQIIEQMKQKEKRDEELLREVGLIKDENINLDPVVINRKKKRQPKKTKTNIASPNKQITRSHKNLNANNSTSENVELTETSEVPLTVSTKRTGKRSANTCLDFESETQPTTPKRGRKSSTQNKGRKSPAQTRGTKSSAQKRVRNSLVQGRSRTRSSTSLLRDLYNAVSPQNRTRNNRRRRRYCWMETIETAILSIGNTHEYPDQSGNQELFSKPRQRENTTDVVLVEDVNTSLNDDNEELSVKVCWQSVEYVKFNIKKYQKISQIFEYFSRREGVQFDRLLFILGDRILKTDDTPDSINYNIGKFIDGGIIETSITTSKNDLKDNTNGILLKFQCADKKKHFETRIDKFEKLSVAMLKCAEHLMQPLTKLKFIFDGEEVSGSSTPESMELEGGECIDVNIIDM